MTYENGMRGDYNNNWINPAEFEGAVNQEIEVYGTLGRGMIDQQDRGFCLADRLQQGPLQQIGIGKDLTLHGLCNLS